MKKIIHVNQHKIKENKKNKTKLLVITVKTYKDNQYVSGVEILDNQNNIVATIIYSPEKPLKCGAHCWIETNCDVRIK